MFGSGRERRAASVGEGRALGAISAEAIGTVLGPVLLTVLQNGTVLLNMSGSWQRVIIGSVVLVAVLVDLFRRREASGGEVLMDRDRRQVCHGTPGGAGGRT